MEHEYVYEVGLTPDDKARISRMLGIRTLNLNDYANAMDIMTPIERLEFDLDIAPTLNNEDLDEYE